eukprot:11088807-Lingulodinium_polyedra.AAC.1
MGIGSCLWGRDPHRGAHCSRISPQQLRSAAWAPPGLPLQPHPAQSRGYRPRGLPHLLGCPGCGGRHVGGGQ